jgi:hypothetical protein
MQCLNHCAYWQDLVESCYYLPDRFIYTTIGQSIKQQNSEGNALRTREIELRTPAPAPLRGLRHAIWGGGR